MQISCQNVLSKLNLSDNIESLEEMSEQGTPLEEHHNENSFEPDPEDGLVEAEE